MSWRPEERDQAAGIRVEGIVRQHLRQLAQRGLAGEDPRDRILERKIENAVEPGVDSIESRAPALEERRQRRVAVEHFAHDLESGVARVDGRRPIAPEPSRHIRHGVLADAVDAGAADPPERVLNQVARHLGIVLVQIRQNAGEPAIERAALRGRRSVRIDQRPGAPGVRKVLRLGAVEPGRRRRILDPGVIRAGVVRHLVLNHLDAERVGAVHQLAEIVERSEVLLDGVEIDRAVAVVIGDRLVVVLLALVQMVDVVVDRREPDGGHAEIFQIGEVLDDPAEIAAVIVAGLRAIVHAARDGRVVVGRVAVGEAVGHQEVDHVVGREALEAAGGGERRDDGEAGDRGAFAVIDPQGISAWRGVGGKVEVQEKVSAGGADGQAAAWGTARRLALRPGCGR